MKNGFQKFLLPGGGYISKDAEEIPKQGEKGKGYKPWEAFQKGIGKSVPLMLCEVKEKITSVFKTRFGKKPGVVSFAPGRVNIIGGHTDYNGGFVLPVALKQGTYIAGAKRKDKKIIVYSENLNEKEAWKTENYEKEESFGDFIRGILKFFPFEITSGFEAIIYSDLPMSSGLSSSAALEISFLYFLMGLEGRKIDKIEAVKIARRAENEFVGLQCGIMDQFTSVFAEEGHLLFLDTRNLKYKHIPFPNIWKIAVVDSGIRRELRTSEYNKRREECKMALKAVKSLYPEVMTLRDVSEEMLFEARKFMGNTAFRRAMHVISENQRVVEFVEYLGKMDLCMIEKTMKLAHQSLSEDFDVSLPELDFLVEAASSLPYVYGARLTGAGFGGSIVAIIKKGKEKKFAEEVEKEYMERFSRKASFIFSYPSFSAYYEYTS